MHTVLALGLALSLAGTDAPAPKEPAAPATAPSAAVVETSRPVGVAPMLQHVERTETHQQEAIAQAQPARGSFWWTVGAIVVAGVILALVLR